LNDKGILSAASCDKQAFPKKIFEAALPLRAMNIDQANAWKAAMAAEEKQRAERIAAWQEEEQRQREQACKIVNHQFRQPDIAYSFRPLTYWGIPALKPLAPCRRLFL
jgi:hypothetical protein